MRERIISSLMESIKIRQNLAEDRAFLSDLETLVHKITSMISQRQACIFTAGNGGSAADAQHIAAELVGQFLIHKRPALNAEALTVDSSVLTSISNDFGFEKIFTRQLEGKAIKGDIFIAMSTSGTSKNILDALSYCKKNGIFTIGLCGNSEMEMSSYCDYLFKVPSSMTPRIQECHMQWAHIFCDLLERELYL